MPKNQLEKFKSGATSSESKPDYSAICPGFITRVARRFGLGNEKHGRGNFVRGIEAQDIQFYRDRYNHAMEHFLALKTESTKSDDHIGAVGWFLSFATEVEQAGVPWNEILKVRTPEEDEIKWGILRTK